VHSKTAVPAPARSASCSAALSGTADACGVKESNPAGTWAVAVAVAAPGPAAAGMQATAPSGDVSRVQQIVQVRCVPCHAVKPTQAGFSAAPNGLVLETVDQLLAHLPQVQQQLSARSMPLGNLTSMTEEERSAMLMWIGHGARH